MESESAVIEELRAIRTGIDLMRTELGAKIDANGHRIERLADRALRIRQDVVTCGALVSALNSETLAWFRLQDRLDDFRRRLEALEERRQ